MRVWLVYHGGDNCWRKKPVEHLRPYPLVGFALPLIRDESTPHMRIRVVGREFVHTTKAAAERDILRRNGYGSLP